MQAAEIILGFFIFLLGLGLYLEQKEKKTIEKLRLSSLKVIALEEIVGLDFSISTGIVKEEQQVLIM